MFKMFFNMKNKEKDKNKKKSTVISLPKNTDVPPVNKYKDLLDKYDYLDKKQ